MCKHEPCELCGRVIFAGFEPMRGHAECRGDLAERTHARLMTVALDPADVGVTDAVSGEPALTEPELESASSDTVANSLLLHRSTVAPKKTSFQG